MQLANNKNHPVYTMSQSDSCDDIVNFMKSRMSFLCEGYPKITKQGTVLIENKLWNKCKSTFEELHNKTIPLNTHLFPISSYIKVNPYIPHYRRPKQNFMKWNSTLSEGGKWTEEYILSPK